MSDAKTREHSLEALTAPVHESKDPAYLAWRDAQVRLVLARANEHPDEMIPERKIWQKYGREY